MLELARIIGDIQIGMIGYVRSRTAHVATAYGNADWIAQRIMKAFYDCLYAGDRQRSFNDFSEDYVNEYAGTAGMFKDIAESFMQFVIGERQQADTLAVQKINFFYDFPELTQVRDRFCQNFGYGIEVNEE